MVQGKRGRGRRERRGVEQFTLALGTGSRIETAQTTANVMEGEYLQ